MEKVREEDISTAVNRAILSNFGDFGAGLCHAGTGLVMKDFFPELGIAVWRVRREMLKELVATCTFIQEYKVDILAVAGRMKTMQAAVQKELQALTPPNDDNPTQQHSKHMCSA